MDGQLILLLIYFLLSSNMKSYNDLTDKEKEIVDMLNKKINDAVMNDLRGFILEQVKLGTAMMKHLENCKTYPNVLPQDIPTPCTHYYLKRSLWTVSQLQSYINDDNYQ